MAPLSGEWLEAIERENFISHIIRRLYKTVMEEYQTQKIFPPAEDMFNAFHFTPLSQVKVVILGQDPYHNDGQAHGLCFSVKRDVEIPPSLVNIYQELHDDLGCYIPDNGYLEKWAKTGSADVEYSTDCPCTSGKLPQGHRLGTVYRCSDPYPE